MEIREIDPDDESRAQRFWKIGKAADELGRPWSSYWSRGETTTVAVAADGRSAGVTEVMVSGHADVNAQMEAVNDRLGDAAVERVAGMYREIR